MRVLEKDAICSLICCGKDRSQFSTRLSGARMRGRKESRRWEEEEEEEEEEERYGAVLRRSRVAPWREDCKMRLIM